MPAKRRGDSASDTTEIGPKDDALLVRFVESLSNGAFVEKLRNMLNPKALTDKLDTLTEKIFQLNEWLDEDIYCCHRGKTVFSGGCS